MKNDKKNRQTMFYLERNMANNQAVAANEIWLSMIEDEEQSSRSDNEACCPLKEHDKQPRVATEKPGCPRGTVKWLSQRN